MYDVVIIGAGITGAAIAMELSKYRLKIAWLERHNDVAIETTRANSGIVHSGYDPMPGSQMAQLNVRGAELYKTLAPKLNIHYKITGSLVIGSTQEDLNLLRELYDRGLQNGVEGLELLEGDAVHALEPNLAPEIRYALHSPTAGIIAPWETCLAFGETAVHNGVELYLNHGVEDITATDSGYRVTASGRTFDTTYVINCAGVYADKIFRMVNRAPEEDFQIQPVRGQYYLLDKSQGSLVSRVIFQTPDERGKGVLVSPTAHGNLIVGPDAQPVEDPEDVKVSADRLAFIRDAARRTTTKINYRENIRNFAGVRARIPGVHDFRIGESPSNPGFINFAGIQSPGLSCGPAFGEKALELLRHAGLKAEEKEDFEYLPLPLCFRDMTPDQVNEQLREDPRYGRIICRCESVSEGEIVRAVHRNIPGTTVDAVKRRTNAGMGRCQGGFCGPKVLEIIKRELGLNATQILQDKEGSYIVAQVKGADDCD